MIITRKALPRRTILRGLGASLALPLLDGMVPALARAAAPVRRFGVVGGLMHVRIEQGDDRAVDLHRVGDVDLAAVSIQEPS